MTITPSRAARIAGAKSAPSGNRPASPRIASIPAKKPGIAAVAGPIWNACVAVPKSATISRSPAPASWRRTCGVCGKKSTTRTSPVAPSRKSAKPPPPGEQSTGSATQAAASAATAASTAEPPARSTSAPASAVTRCPAATMPPALTAAPPRGSAASSARECASDRPAQTRCSLPSDAAACARHAGRSHFPPPPPPARG